jgi:hypothetical protein
MTPEDNTQESLENEVLESIKNLKEMLGPISRQMIKTLVRNFFIYEHNQFKKLVPEDSNGYKFIDTFSEHLYTRIETDEKLRIKLQTLINEFVEKIFQDDEFEEIFLSRLNEDQEYE